MLAVVTIILLNLIVASIVLYVSLIAVDELSKRVYVDYEVTRHLLIGMISLIAIGATFQMILRLQ